MIRGEIRRALREEPWLEWYLEPYDEDLDPARVRFAVAQRIATRELAGTNAHVAVRYTRGALLTTSYTPDSDHEDHEEGPHQLHARQRTQERVMSAPAAAPPPVVVEENGRILRAVALPYRVETIVIGPGRRGHRMAHRESFDQESLPEVGAMYGLPFLISHDPSRPTGRVLSSRSTERGLEIEAELLANDQELESIRRRAAAGIMDRLSVGFIPSPRQDVWLEPDESGLPGVLRRGAHIREISLVLWPAFDGARVEGIHARTRAGAARHEASARLIGEMSLMTAEVRTMLARRR